MAWQRSEGASLHAPQSRDQLSNVKIGNTAHGSTLHAHDRRGEKDHLYTARAGTQERRPLRPVAPSGDAVRRAMSCS